MDGCPERAIDTHIYQAWREPDSRIGFYTDACGQKSAINAMEQAFGPVIVGEWSLATDNCCLWLNGFNDNLPGYPRLPCKYATCRESYLGNDHPGNPLDPNKGLQGPYGSGMSGPIFGQCPCTRDWVKESSGNPLTGRDWLRAPPSAPKHLDDTDTVMKHLALKKISAFSGVGRGFFFWNFRSDGYDPQWSYMEALERGWIPNGNLNDESILKACEREDSGTFFKCVLKNGQLDESVHDAVAYALNFQNLTGTRDAQVILNLTGGPLRDAAQQVLGDFFEMFCSQGATCDFGGICMLVETNQNVSNDESVGWSDDEYFITVNTGPPLWLLIVSGVVISLIAGLVGFVLAMRFNPVFNRKVRESRMFAPLANSSNKFLRHSLGLTSINDYEEIRNLVKEDD